MKLSYSILMLLGLLFIASCGGGDSNPTPDLSGSVTVKITVLKLPDQIDINKTSTGGSSVEYWWSAVFDINDDAIVNTGDVQLILNHTKPAGAQEQQAKVADLDAVFADIVDSEYGYAIRPLGSINVEVIDNTIILSVSKSEYAAYLADLSQSTRVNFHTIGIDGRDRQHRDYYPANDTYSEMTEDGKFNDASGDIDNDNSLQHIDLISMEVIID